MPGADADKHPGPPPADRTRLVGGGVGVVVTILGYTATQAVVATAGLPEQWTLLALPVFGVLGAVSFVYLFSAFLALDGGASDAESDGF